MIRQIQKQPRGSSSSPGNTPLFLFHDASGTISCYYALGNLGRDVYAVADSRTKTMDDSESDDGDTIPAMGRRYYAAIKAIVPEGRILLGGWSLGGMIALQVASIIARDPRVQVDGIIMLDSPYPDYRHVICPDYRDRGSQSPVSDDSDGPSSESLTAQKLEQAVLRFVDMLHKWRVPASRQQRDHGHGHAHGSRQQPCTIMLCASDKIGSFARSYPALLAIDQFRDSPTLGWNEKLGGGIVHKSYLVKGHHFSLFEPENVTSLTETLATIANGLELAARLAQQELEDDDYLT